MQENVEGFRLSPQQRRLWLLREGGHVYRSQCVINVQGDIKAEVMREALRGLADRHEILRTTFRRLPGLKYPFQIVAESASLSWQHGDISDSDARTQQSRIAEAFEEERLREIDLERGPLLRSCLLTLSPREHVLIVSLPALCADTRTMMNLPGEIGSAYRALSEGKEEEAADEPLQYADFSEWINELLEAEETEASRINWHQEDRCALAAWAFPFEARAAGRPLFKPASLQRTLHPAVAADLELIAGKYETSMSVLLLACWQVLLWRLTGLPEIIVGQVCDGRRYEELDSALGLFARYVPVGCHFAEESSFSDILRCAHESSSDARTRQDYFNWQPKTASTEDGLEATFFPVGFEYADEPAKYRADTFSLSLQRHRVCFDRFKVKLDCVKRDDTLFMEIQYDSSLIAEDAVECLLGQLATLLESVAADPEAAVDELEIVGEEERRRLLIELHGTRRDYALAGCIHELFEQQAELAPWETAVIFEDEQLSYAELNARANQLGHYLQSLGVGPEVLVALYAERTLDVIVGMLGVLKAGGAYAPLEPGQPLARLAHMLSDLSPPVILTQERLAGSLPHHVARVVCLDTDWQTIAHESRDNTDSRATVGNTVYVIFTSGSTGKPKGVAVEHRQLLNYVRAVTERLALPRASSYATISTFAADLGHTAIFPALCLGGSLHVLSQAQSTDPPALAEHFRRHNPVDCLKIVPSHLEALLASSEAGRILPSQRLVLGGESAHWDLVRRLKEIAPSCEVYNHYGPTEATVGAITHHIVRETQERAQTSLVVPLGRPLANTEIYLLDRHKRTVATGQLGELHIGGAGVARGYLKRPGLTAEKFIPHPFSHEPGRRLYVTGDLARYRADGTIEFFGRADNQIKFHGYRVELDEIKGALNRHALVKDCAVTVMKDEHDRDLIVAYYVSQRELEAAVLREHLRANIIAETIPNLFVRVQKIPLTSNGKVDRRALPDLSEIRRRMTRTFVAPRTPTERAVAHICAEVLGVERIGLRDNFFELGGHSLMATRVMTGLRETFQIELPLRTIFEAPTVESLALAITQMQVVEEDGEEMARLIEELRRLPGDAIDDLLKEELQSAEALEPE